MAKRNFIERWLTQCVWTGGAGRGSDFRDPKNWHGGRVPQGDALWTTKELLDDAAAFYPNMAEEFATNAAACHT